MKLKLNSPNQNNLVDQNSLLIILYRSFSLDGFVEYNHLEILKEREINNTFIVLNLENNVKPLCQCTNRFNGDLRVIKSVIVFSMNRFVKV